MVLIVFDLDDTLYLERDYVRSGYRAGAISIATATGVDANLVAEFMNAEFDREPQSDVFAEMLKWLDLDPDTKPDLIKTYRDHEPDIQLIDGVESLLTELRDGGVRLGLITDGDSKRQRLKIQALNLGSFFVKIIVTGDYGRAFWKPHPRAFEKMQSGFLGHAGVYVGDNVSKDFLIPNRLGWKSVRLVQPEQLHGGQGSVPVNGRPSVTVYSIEELGMILNRFFLQHANSSPSSESH